MPIPRRGMHKGRRMPRTSELAPLIGFARPPLSPARYRQARLDRPLTIWDLRDMARRRAPRAAFDYADGAAEGELSLTRARQAFADVQFHPAVLRDVSAVRTGWDVL